jgi:ubiquinone/menaquinone biosynthesis C-methylase UbiE
MTRASNTSAHPVSPFAMSRRRSGVPPRTWKRLAGCYDRQLWLERSAVRTALDLANPGPGDRLLDLGTGTGEVLRQLATRPARPQFVVGVDTSSAMLSRLPVLPLGWTASEGDALALPFPDGEFTVAVASYVLHVLPELRLAKALSEVARVLRPGGRLITVTPVLPERGVLRPLAAAGNAAAQRAPALFGGLRAFDPARALEQAGFTLLRGRTLQRGYPSLCILAQKPVPATGPHTPIRPLKSRRLPAT